jgi:hypothetical protein
MDQIPCFIWCKGWNCENNQALVRRNHISDFSDDSQKVEVVNLTN